MNMYCLHFNKSMPCISTCCYVITTSGGMFELACRTIIHISEKGLQYESILIGSYSRFIHLLK